jgi:hypothetical protein
MVVIQWGRGNCFGYKLQAISYKWQASTYKRELEMAQRGFHGVNIKLSAINMKPLCVTFYKLEEGQLLVWLNYFEVWVYAMPGFATNPGFTATHQLFEMRVCENPRWGKR